MATACSPTAASPSGPESSQSSSSSLSSPNSDTINSSEESVYTSASCSDEDEMEVANSSTTQQTTFYMTRATGQADPAHVERCTTIMISALRGLKKEDFLNKTLRGPQLQEIIDHLLKLKRDQIATLSVKVCDELECCLLSKGNCLLPNQMWRAFHQVRLSDRLKEMWREFIMYASLPSHLYAHTNQCYQLVLDRVFKDMLVQKKGPMHSVASDDGALSVREENVVRYMSGYIAFHLSKKYRKGTTDPELRSKWKYFTHVLGRMKAEEQLPCEDSIEDYSRAWTEHIDRGGLCHIKPEVHRFFVMIEKVTRRHLRADQLHSLQNTDLYTVMTDDILKDVALLEIWENISKPTSQRYSTYSVELLKHVCRLWITVRGFSFAKGCNSLFHKTFERGTRKTLSSKGTDKEA